MTCCPSPCNVIRVSSTYTEGHTMTTTAIAPTMTIVIPAGSTTDANGFVSYVRERVDVTLPMPTAHGSLEEARAMVAATCDALGLTYRQDTGPKAFCTDYATPDVDRFYLEVDYGYSTIGRGFSTW